ncbi:ribonuclease H-like domain-containing protein [Alkalicoccobacillus porphyridii]|uniref:ribonuclease H-like domain-containing protein n=1 Tax=Alkalicoccobacillus porphyridii TaxID=2597270 RepID=UPI00163D51FC|nr:ribonuclease H-like domain-containing protein [Alkalicoccobacillus porphyridii]
MPIRDKLKRLESHTGLKSKDNKIEPKPYLPSQDVPYQHQWSKLEATIKWLDDQYVIVRDVEYPLHTMHGSLDFSSLYKAVHAWNETEQNHPLSSKGLQAEELLFFDTETTGLYTGAGHHIFLLGYAQIKQSKVHVKQYLLPGPESEAALYYHFLSDASELRHLVTYNGKAFDWPQVKTRHAFVRDQVPKLPAFGHFDLLHASRRLWKNELPSCKLAVVEEEILDVYREHDTLSYLVPMMYFDFVKEQSPDLMEGVLKHHETDLLSLITLYSQLTFKILDCSEKKLTGNEHYEIGRWFAAMEEEEKATYHLEKALNDKTEPKSLYELALLRKKQKKFDQALSHFQQVCQTSYKKIDAAVECAMIYEHQYKQINEAIHFTQMALDEASSSNNAKVERDIQLRLARLKKKQAKK